jgi:CRP/FNR family transcriptional regulator, cyclic AMP receptor protein
MKVLARRLQDTNNVLAASSFLAANGRVAGALLSIAEAFGKDVGNGRIRAEEALSDQAMSPKFSECDVSAPACAKL